MTSWRVGSSPRGRGKPPHLRAFVRRGRLIPAWAGKTPRSAWNRPAARAHPRVGGENASSHPLTDGETGSSPRGRGKRRQRSKQLTTTGLIPAWAGKTAPRSHALPDPAAHPRVGGENSSTKWTAVRENGSSPRGRGKPTRTVPGTSYKRLIPAWAGKTALISTRPM